MFLSKLTSENLADTVIRYRWLIIMFCFGLAALFGLLIPGIETDPEIRNYVPSTMKSRIETDKIESEFGVQDMVVILFSDSCIIDTDNLKQIRKIDNEISRINGVSAHVSPFSVRTIKGDSGMMIVKPLIGKIPEDSSGIRNLAGSILSNRFARDIVISSDLTSASITASIGSNEPENKTLLRIDSIINAYPGHAAIATGGLPYIRKYILEDVRIDGLILVPAALIIMLIILKVTLGEWKSLLMPFSVVVISTVVSMGMIPLFGWKMSILTLLVPVILVAVGNNYGIYLVARSQEILEKEPGLSKPQLLKTLLKSLNMPIFFSGLTTIAGILGLLTHSIIPARQVGILAAAGVTVALLLSLLLIPVLIYFRSNIIEHQENKKKKSQVFAWVISSVSGLIVKYPGKILVISVLFTLAASSGIFLVKIDTNQENYFPKNHPVGLASKIINSKFGGSQTISIMISGDIKSTEVMTGIDRLTLDLEKQKGVGKVFSISQVVREMSKAIYNINENGFDKIPDSDEGVAQMFELYNMSGDQDDFNQLMNLDYSRAHILLRLSDPENDVINDLKERIIELSGSIPADVTLGGYAIIMADFAGSLIKGQISSLIFALVTVLILLMIIFRSFKGGLIGSIPLAMSMIILFGFMGIAGIKLDGATALLSSIMVGVGVDFTIQYIWCLNSLLIKGLSYSDASITAMNTIGRSIIINAVSVMAGFSALMFSGFTSIRFFGYLVLISIGSCLIGALFIIPAFIMKFRPQFIERNFRRNK